MVSISATQGSDSFVSKLGRQRRSATSGGSMLSDAYVNQNRHKWAKKCARGYSQHLLYIDHSCEISFCTRNQIMSDAYIGRIERPPFVLANYVSPNNTGEVAVVLTPNDKKWIKDDSGKWGPEHIIQKQRQEAATNKDDKGMSMTMHSILVVFLTLSVTIVLGAITMFIIYKRNHYHLVRLDGHGKDAGVLNSLHPSIANISTSYAELSRQHAATSTTTIENCQNA